MVYVRKHNRRRPRRGRRRVVRRRKVVRSIGKWKKFTVRKDVDGAIEILYDINGFHWLAIRKFMGVGHWSISKWIGNSMFTLIGEREKDLGSFLKRENAIKFAENWMRRHPSG